MHTNPLAKACSTDLERRGTVPKAKKWFRVFSEKWETPKNDEKDID